MDYRRYDFAPEVRARDGQRQFFLVVGVAALVILAVIVATHPEAIPGFIQHLLGRLPGH